MNRFLITSFALAAAMLVASRVLAAPLYTITDLPAFDGPVNGRFIQSYGYGINASGEITGTAGGDMANHAFIYDGTMHDLGTLAAGQSTLAGPQSTGFGINANGCLPCKYCR
jgi:probable HAF family extracellular repeat protein